MAETNKYSECPTCFQDHQYGRCIRDFQKIEPFTFQEDDDQRIYGIFQKVFQVLSAELDRITEVASEELARALESVQKHYKTKNANKRPRLESNSSSDRGSVRGQKDFSSASHRAAYLMLYSSCVSCLLHTCLNRAIKENGDNKVKAWTDRLKTSGKLNVVSLGGGPGTDLFGLMAFFKQYFGDMREMILEYTSLEAADEWEDTMKVTENVCKESMGPQWKNICLSLKKFNLLGPLDGDVRKKIEEADIVLVLLVISELYPEEQRSSRREQQVLKMLNETRKSMKKGAWMMYVDISPKIFQDIYYEGIQGRQNGRIHKLVFPIYKHVECEFYKNLRRKSEEWNKLIYQFSERFSTWTKPLGCIPVTLALTEKME